MDDGEENVMKNGRSGIGMELNHLRNLLRAQQLSSATVILAQCEMGPSNSILSSPGKTDIQNNNNNNNKKFENH